MMFERFTADARGVVVGAQAVAREAHASTIDATHLLVALARQTAGPGHEALETVGLQPQSLSCATAETQSLDAQALATLGIDLEAVSARADEVFGADALARAGRRGPRGHIPFTNEAKKVLEISLREAIRLGSKTIHSGHILRAIIRLDDTAAFRELNRALRDIGSDGPALIAVLDRIDGGSRLAS